jgi:hypothetical protein
MDELARVSALPDDTMTTGLGRFRDLMGFEWIKVRSVRSTYGVVAVAFLLAVAVGIITSSFEASGWNQETPDYKYHFDALADTYGGFLLAQLLFGCIGVLAVTGEYSSGLIRTTFTAAPGRRAVLTAKAAVVAAVTFVVGTVAALVSFFGSQWGLSAANLNMSFGDSAAVRGLVATVFCLIAAALLGLAFGVITRHAVAAVAILVALLFIGPQVLHGLSGWALAVDNALPGTAYRRLISTQLWDGAPSIAQAWIVAVVWPVIAMIAASVVIHRRDA